MIRATFRSSAIVLLVIFLTPAAFPQSKKGKQKSSDTQKDQLTFKVPVDVVVVNATATDKQGKPVMDLTAGDFKIYEDGKPQSIQTFAAESYGREEAKDAAPGQPPVGRAKPETPGKAPPRLISLFVDDMTSASSDNYVFMIEAVKKFVQSDVGPNDQVAITAGSGRVQYPFSADKQALLGEVAGILNKLNLQAVHRGTCPVLTDLQAQWISRSAARGPEVTYGRDMILETALQETILCVPLMGKNPREEAKPIVFGAADTRMYEMYYRNRTLLQGLRQHIRSLKHFEARKLVMLFSPGFLSSEVLYELQDVVDQALRNGVVLNTVDIRGLYTTNLKAGEAAANVPPQFFSWKQRMLTEDASARQDPLSSLALDTGGTFYHNSNDLYAGLRQISQRQAYYYVMTYASPSQKADGRYHKIKLEVSRPDVELSYRKGYYSPKEEMTFERRKKEDVLEALRAPGNMNEIPIRISYNCYQLENSRYEVDLTTQVDIRRIQFLDEEARSRNLISVAVVALDEQERYVDGVSKDVEFRLTPGGYTDVLNRGFASKVGLELPPGKFKIRAIVRESVQGKMGSLTKVIEIP